MQSIASEVGCGDALVHKPRFRLHPDSIADPFPPTLGKSCKVFPQHCFAMGMRSVLRDRRTPMNPGILSRHVHTSFPTRPSHL